MNTSPFNQRWNMVEKRSQGRSFLEERDTSGGTLEDQEYLAICAEDQVVIVDRIR
jgi:hypothetical protein